MGTHPIFESDFDCLTDCRDHSSNLRLSQFDAVVDKEGKQHNDYGAESNQSLGISSTWSTSD